jgi:hypothetical protein
VSLVPYPHAYAAAWDSRTAARRTRSCLRTPGARVPTVEEPATGAVPASTVPTSVVPVDAQGEGVRTPSIRRRPYQVSVARPASPANVVACPCPNVVAAPIHQPRPILPHPPTPSCTPVPKLLRAPVRTPPHPLSQHHTRPCPPAADTSPVPPLSSNRSCPTHWSHEPLLGPRLHSNNNSPWISHGLIPSLGKPHLPLPFVPQPSNSITMSRSPAIGFQSNQFLFL